MTNSNSGAKAAFRGFRTQTIYILYRLLSQKSNETFIPEGVEDLLIKQNNKNLEIIQVKNYSSNLNMSDLSSKKDDFFNRSIQSLQKTKLKIKLVSFGKLGRELANYQKNQGSKPITKKLINKYNFNQKQVELLFKNWTIETFTEEALLEEVKDKLNEYITGIDWQTAFELLMYWIYVASEEKIEITKQSLLQKLQSIGQFISERHTFLTQFGTTVKNIAKENEDIETRYLKEEFYNGASAKYAHIKANLDILRPSKLNEIKACFQKSNITIIHGASGQGKSTLSYRYIYENYPAEYAFEIKYEERKDVRNIISTLKTLSKPFDKPFLIYIDVLPNNTFWIEFINELSLIKNCNVLISIREEDLNRNQNIREWVNPATLKLNFSEVEAKEIYKKFEEKGTITNFLDFEETWLSFGGKGPLLEFAYLINQGKKLEDKLENQVNNLRDKANRNNEWKQIKLLKLVALADKYDCRIDLKKVVKEIKLEDSKRTLKWFQDEYLIRKSEDSSWLEGLHHIRSSILTDLLFDFEEDEPAEVFTTLIKVLKQEDLGLLLLHYFADFTDYKPILETIALYQTSSWTNYTAIFDSLMWLGTKNYVRGNYTYIREIKSLVDKSWILFVPPIYYQGQKFNFDKLTKNIDEKTLTKVNLLKDEISDYKDVFHEAKEWLQLSKLPEFDSCNENDLSNLGKILFWSSQFSINRNFEFEQYDFNFIFKKTSLKSLSNLMHGLYFYNQATQDIWINNKDKFLERFRIEKNVPLIVEDTERIKLHFICKSTLPSDDTDEIITPQTGVVKEDISAKEKSDSLNSNISVHEQTISLINIIQKAIPEKGKYASQGYGHKISLIDIPFDDSVKDMTSNPVDWIATYYKCFRSLLEYEDRSKGWEEIAIHLYDNRQRILGLFQSFINVISKYYKTNQFKEIEIYWFSYKSNWYNNDLNFDRFFPQEAVDKWGFVTESDKDTKDETNQNSYFLKVYPHLKVIKEFQKNISNFFRQSDMIIQSKFLQKEVDKNIQRISVINLLHGIQKLSDYQKSFRQYFAKYKFTDLEKLEKQELEIYKSMLFVWQYFNYKPFKKQKDLLSKIQRNIKTIQDSIDIKMLFNLNKLKRSKIIEDYEIVEEKERQKIWIIVYGNDFISLSASLEQVAKAIQNTLVNTKLPSAKSLVLELEYPTFSIIPLIDNITVGDIYFEIPLFKMTSQDYNLISLLTAKKLSFQDFEFLDIDKGSVIIPQLNLPKQLNINIQMMSFHLNYIYQLKEIYQKEDVSRFLIGKLVLERVIQLSEIWNENYLLIEKCINTFFDEKIPIEERAKHEEFSNFLEPVVNTIGSLHQFFEYFQTLDIDNDLIDFNIIEKYNSKMLSIINQSAVVYIYWSNEIFNNAYSS